MSNNDQGKTKKIFMAHNACFNASYDFNLLKEGLRRSGNHLVDKPEEADEVIFSGCAVRELWVDDAINQINAIHDRAPAAKVTVTGCVASVNADRIRDKTHLDALVFGRQEDILRKYAGLELDSLDREVTQDTSLSYEQTNGNDLQNLKRRVGPEKAEIVALLQQVDREYATEVEKLYRRTTKGFIFYNEDEPTEFITVTRSCPYKCTFCVIPMGRGEYASVPLDFILEKARASLSRGIRRITLVGDEVGNYGTEVNGPKFRDLLTAMFALDPGLRLSIRYIEPKPFMRNAELFRRECGNGRFELLYVSLQSGSQRVLNSMGRRYNIDRVSKFYSEMRRNTDTVFYCNWMVGFPDETIMEYEETVHLAQELNLQINIPIPFSKRPGTPAGDMENQISIAEKERRFLDLSRVVANLKVADFASHLKFLDPGRRMLLLEKINKAELFQYEAPTESPKPNRVHLKII